MKVKFFSALSTETSTLRASIHCLRHWPYHSKIPRTSAELTVRWLVWPVYDWLLRLTL